MITGIKDGAISQSQLLSGPIDILNISRAKSKLKVFTVTNIYGAMTTKNSCFLMIMAIVVLVLGFGQLGSKLESNGQGGSSWSQWRPGRYLTIKSPTCRGRSSMIAITMTLALELDDNDNWLAG